jgi:competence protein ComEC
MKSDVYAKESGHCRIKTFDLNSRDTGAMGIPELNPADSFLISTFDENGHETHILLDAGKKGQADNIIIPYLRENNILTIDYLILSHMHYDHFGGIIDIMKDPDITVREVIYAPISDTSIDNCDVGELNSSLCREMLELVHLPNQKVTTIGKDRVGGIIPINNDLYFDIISVPDESFISSGQRAPLNNLNLVVKLNYRKFTALFPGDCGVIQTGFITQSALYEKVKDVVLLKASHHGGNESTTKEFIETCNPQIVIIPCNHLVVDHVPPFITNLHIFERNGAKVFRCDLYRELDILTDGHTVHCMGRTDKFVEHVSFEDNL